MEKRGMISLISIFILCISSAQAATIEATGCSHSAVQTAINSANDGDTVKVPAGTCQWDSYVNVNRELKLHGAGMDKTEIQRYGFEIADALDNMEVTGFTFNGEGFHEGFGQDSSSMMAVKMYSNRMKGNKNIRIHHNRFTNYYWQYDDNTPHRVYVIGIKGYSSGVIDHNEFIDCLGENIMVCGDGVTSWSRGGYPEEDDDGIIYIEDNTATITGTVGCGTGDFAGQCGRAANLVDDGNAARYVMRFNTLTYYGKYSRYDDPWDSHGICNGCNSGDPRGTYYLGIYENTVTGESGSAWHNGGNTRGGYNIIFNNEYTMTGGNTYPAGQQLYIERVAKDTCPNTAPYPQNCEPDMGGEGYPCQDQVRSSYIFNNRKNSQQMPIKIFAADDPYLDNGRDYWYGNSPGSSYAGWGTRAERPGCSRNGQSYWSTDQGEWNSNNIGPDGTLDRCDSSLKWVNAWYTPYTYPHPLQGEKGHVDACGDGNCSADESCHSCEPDCGACEYPKDSLINNATMTGNSQNFRSDHAVEHLWDGCTEVLPECTSGNTAISSFWVEFDLGEPYYLTTARLFGDTEGAWVSKTWELKYRLNSSDPWTTASDADAHFNDWSEIIINATARYVRVEVFSDTGAVQAREIEIYGIQVKECYGADNNCDGCINISELSEHINRWKNGNVLISELMEVIVLWKKGCD